MLVVKVSEKSRQGLHKNAKGVERSKYQTGDTAVSSSLPVGRAEKVHWYLEHTHTPSTGKASRLLRSEWKRPSELHPPFARESL